jgi:tetratricopeptide (TPR) repeat protein
MKVNLVVLFLIAAVGRSADLRSDLAVGRAYYAEGDFRKAVTHLQRQLKLDPDEPEVNYWTGMAFQGLGDVATPFGARYNAKAIVYLTRAAALAPGRSDYRKALFDFLADSASESPAALRLAQGMLSRTPESDPEYNAMRRRIELARRTSSSAGVRFDRLFLAIPRTGFRVVPQ